MISYKTITAALGALLACFAASADVFSDAATWHQGFYESGTMGASSATAFPDKLRAGDPSSNYHKLTRGGFSSGVQFETDTVVYPNPYPPYSNLVSRTETVAYLPQTYVADTKGNSTIQLTNPFAVTNTASFTFFVRFKWDGTTRKDGIARFLNAGYHYQNSGFLLGVKTGGQLNLYAKDGVLPDSANTQCDSESSMVTPNVWTDCAVVVADNKMTVYTLASGEAMKSTVMTEVFGARGTPSSTPSYKTWVRLGGEEGKADSSAYCAFPGYFHAFASWPRALSEDEVKQVFAYPSTADLVRLGTKNGSSLEFKGATLGGAESGSATEDWAAEAPSLTAEAPTQTISFSVPARFAGVPQVFRVTFAPNSASGKVNVSIGGTTVEELTAEPGKSDLLTIKGDLLTSGAKTLVLTRDATSLGDIVFDEIALGGGFQLGINDNNKDDGFSPNNDGSVFGDYYACCTNALYTNVHNDLPAQGTKEYTKQYFHVYVPDEIAGNEECKVVFKSNVQTRGHTFALSVNGSEVTRKVCNSDAAGGAAWCAFECEIPATALVPGDNEFLFANVTGGGYAYCNIDYYRLETIYKKKRGFCVIVF